MAASVRLWGRLAGLAVLGTASLLVGTARAQLFEDVQARNAIIELRQSVIRLGQAQDEIKQVQDEIKQAQAQALTDSSLFQLTERLQQLEDALASLRGANEVLTRDNQLLQQQVQALQASQTAYREQLEQRMAKFEPQQVTVDGQTFTALPEEKAAFDGVLTLVREGKFADVEPALGEFLTRYPESGYLPAALFWLGNAQYANERFDLAKQTFEKLVQGAPTYARLPEAELALANSLIELKDMDGAKARFTRVLSTYPGTPAAEVAARRLEALGPKTSG